MNLFGQKYREEGMVSFSLYFVNRINYGYDRLINSDFNNLAGWLNSLFL